MDEMKFKIVSGGQTGIDQAALAAAVAAEVPYSGWIPKGRRTEAGTLDAKYTAMQEMPTDDYRKRTRQNVVDSDATLILTWGEPEGGTLPSMTRTLIRYCGFRRRDEDEPSSDSFALSR